MPYSDNYRAQVELLVRSLPTVAAEECFALKGGTAINLFVRNLPRLSVDIDLTYLPISGRDEALEEIDWALRKIGERVQANTPGMTVTGSAPGTQDSINKVVLRTRDRVQIKVEVTPVLASVEVRNDKRAKRVSSVILQPRTTVGFAGCRGSS